MKRFFREPLLHFAVLGFALFALYATINPEAMQSESTIVVSKGRLDSFVAGFRQTWNRDPSSEELQSLVDDYVLEEIYYRQAVTMGIDKNDPVIRRRLRQKMELLTSAFMANEAPTDEQLSEYLSEHPDQYQIGPLFTFEQRFIRLDRPDAQIHAAISEAEQKLGQGADFVGDQSLVSSQFYEADRYQLGRLFGNGFIESLEALPVGDWQGPVRSGLGVHFVRISDRTERSMPLLAEVRSTVERDWKYEQAQTAKSLLKQRLLAQYSVELPTSEITN